MSNRKGEPVVRTFTARDKELKVYYFTEMFGAKLDCAFLCVFSVDRDRMTLYLPNERKPPLPRRRVSTTAAIGAHVYVSCLISIR